MNKTILLIESKRDDYTPSYTTRMRNKKGGLIVMKKQNLYKMAGFEWCDIAKEWRVEIFNPYGANWALTVDGDADKYDEADEAEGLQGYKLGTVENFGARMIAGSLDLLLMCKNWCHVDAANAERFYWCGGLLNYNYGIELNNNAKISALKFWRNKYNVIKCAAYIEVDGSTFWAWVDVGECVDFYDLATIND